MKIIPTSLSRVPIILIVIVVISAGLLKIDWDSKIAASARDGIIQSRPLTIAVSAVEIVAGAALLTGAGGARVRLTGAILFTALAGVASAKAIHGESSCGCFGAIPVPPWATAAFDVVAAVLLFSTRRPTWDVSRDRPQARLAAFVTISVALLGSGGILEWRGAAARAAGAGAFASGVFPGATNGAESAPAPDFPGDAGTLVILEPEKWVGEPLPILRHVDCGSQIAHGQWVVLLVHHDCDVCMSAIPRYETAASTGEAVPRLAVIEMPPYSEDKAGVLSASSPATAGRLDQARDWFATTPVAVRLKDGVVTAAADGDKAATPDPTWWSGVHSR